MCEQKQYNVYLLQVAIGSTGCLTVKCVGYTKESVFPDKAALVPSHHFVVFDSVIYVCPARIEKSQVWVSCEDVIALLTLMGLITSLDTPTGTGIISKFQEISHWWPTRLSPIIPEEIRVVLGVPLDPQMAQ